MSREGRRAPCTERLWSPEGRGRVEHGEYAELRRFAGEVEGRFVRSLSLPASAGVDAERHLALLEHGASLVGRPLDAFRCYRMHIAYPPAYTRAVVRWLLPEKPRE